MFGNVMRDTASRRALAAIVNTLDLQIINRRDTAKSSQDRAELRMFILTYNAFKSAWDHLNPDSDPVSYALAWDDHLSTLLFGKAKMENLVKKNVQNILAEVEDDMKLLLPVSSIDNIRSAEKALSEIVNINRNLVLA